MNETNVLFYDAVIEDGNIFFFDNLSQCMCEVSLDNFSLKIMGEYIEKKNTNIYKIFLVNHKFYLLGWNYGEVLIFDRDKEIFYTVGSKGDFSSGIQYIFYNNYIFYLPNDISLKICVFDVKFERFFYQNSIGETLGMKGICARVSRSGNILYCAIKDQLFYVKYDLDKMEINQIIYVEDIKDISIVDKIDEQIWLADNNSLELVCINNEQISKFLVKHTVSSIIELNDVICVLFRYHNTILFIDKISSEIKTIELLFKKDKYERNKGDSNFSSCIEDRFFYYLLPWKSCDMIRISKKDYTCEKIQFLSSYENFGMKNIFEKHDFFQESDVFNLQKFLLATCEDEKVREKNVVNGTYLWKSIR